MAKGVRVHRKEQARRAEKTAPRRLSLRVEWWLCAVALLLAPLIAGQFDVKPFPAAGFWAQFSGMWSGQTPLLGYLPVGVAILAGLVTAAWRLRVCRFPPLPMLIAFLAFWALIAGSVANSEFQDTGVRELVRWSVCLCAFVLVAGLMGRGRAALAFGAVIALAGSVEALIALREYIGNLLTVPDWRVFGTLFNPNFLAGYLVLIIPLCLAFVGRYRETAWPLVALLGFLPLPALFLTGSRGGLLAGCVAVVAFVTLAAWNRRLDRRVVGSVVAALALTAALFVLQSSLAGGSRVAGGPENIEHSGAFREYLWKDTTRMIGEVPVAGYGLGSFAWAHGPTATVGFTRLAHNTYLQIGAEAGVPALLALLVFFALWARRVFPRGGVESGEQLLGVDAPLLRAAAVAGVLGAAAHNLFDSDAYLLACNLTLWSLMGLALAVSVDGVQPLLLPRAAFGLIASALGALVGLPLVAQAIGASYAASATAERDLGDLAYAEYGPSSAQPHWAAALVGFDHAVAWQGRNRRYLMAAAEVSGTLGRTDDALALAERAVRVEPSAEAYIAKARLHQGLGDPAGAEGAFKDVLRRSPYSEAAQRELMRIYEAAGRTEDLLRTARRAAEQRASTYASVRAVPEIVETVYADANLVLARHALRQNDLAGAVGRLTPAFTDYSEFMRVTYPMTIERGEYSPISAGMAEAIAEQYFTATALLLRTLRKLNRTDDIRTVHAAVREAADAVAAAYDRAGRKDDAQRFEQRVTDLLMWRVPISAAALRSAAGEWKKRCAVIPSGSEESGRESSWCGEIPHHRRRSGSE